MIHFFATDFVYLVMHKRRGHFFISIASKIFFRIIINLIVITITSSITVLKREREGRAYLNPNFFFQAALSGQWPFGLLKLGKTNWDWDPSSLSFISAVMLNVVTIKVLYDRVWNKKNYYLIPAFVPLSSLNMKYQERENSKVMLQFPNNWDVIDFIWISHSWSSLFEIQKGRNFKMIFPIHDIQEIQDI